MTQKFTLVGSGLAGGLLAAYLGRRGYEVFLYERRPDPRAGNFVGGRSINLALSTRGIDALARVGLADQVLAHAIPMRGRMIHDRNGALHFSPYDRDPRKCINSIGRAALNTTVIEAAQKFPNVRVQFNQQCTRVDLEAGAAEFVDTATSQKTSVTHDAVIGVDGAFSAVRRSMKEQLSGFVESESYLDHGYKELTIPPDEKGNWRMEKHALHIWPRGNFMMIALPNLDGSFTATLFWPFEGPNSFAALRSEGDVLNFFREQFPDAVSLIPALAEEFLANPTGSLVTIRCRPWHTGRVVLVGDACHAVVPFLGQGMNAAFEDCTVLNRCLAEEHWEWAKAFGRYEMLRKEHADALADLCVANFVEMRDHVASTRFLLQKKLAILLHALLPRWYLPLYTMIEFTRIPYADAVRRARAQAYTIAAGLAILLAGTLVLLWWLW